MFRWYAEDIELNRTGAGIVMDCADLTELRGQVELKLGTIGATVVTFYGNVRPGGAFVAFASTITGVGILATSINVKAYAQCALKITTPSGSADDLGILTLAGWSEHCPQEVHGKYVSADMKAVGGTRRTIDDGVFGGDGASGSGTDGGGTLP